MSDQTRSGENPRLTWNDFLPAGELDPVTTQSDDTEPTWLSRSLAVDPVETAMASVEPPPC